MPPVLFDTSVYISALRRPGAAGMEWKRFTNGAAVWLSSVVLEELYAGASPRGRFAIERLERDFERARRILVPNLTDWTQTGRVLSLLGTKYGHEEIGRGRLTNDALIALSAGRTGITVLTANVRDYRRLAEFRPFSWRVLEAVRS